MLQVVHLPLGLCPISPKPWLASSSFTDQVQMYQPLLCLKSGFWCRLKSSKIRNCRRTVRLGWRGMPPNGYVEGVSVKRSEHISDEEGSPRTGPS